MASDRGNPYSDSEIWRVNNSRIVWVSCRTDRLHLSLFSLSRFVPQQGLVRSVQYPPPVSLSHVTFSTACIHDLQLMSRSWSSLKYKSSDPRAASSWKWPRSNRGESCLFSRRLDASRSLPTAVLAARALNDMYDSIAHIVHMPTSHLSLPAISLHSFRLSSSCHRAICLITRG